MDWPSLRNTAMGAFAGGIGVVIAIVTVIALLVGMAHVLTFLVDRT